MPISRKLWLKCSGAVLGAQLSLWAVIEFCMTGAPVWAESIYAPFQVAFVHLLGPYWAYGLVLGVVVGAVVYSSAGGLICAWVFRKKH